MLLDERVAQVTTEAEAVRFALDLYGLEVAAKTLPGEYDDNFYLTTIERSPSRRSIAGDPNSAGRSLRGFWHSCSSAPPRPEGCWFGRAKRFWSADCALFWAPR